MCTTKSSMKVEATCGDARAGCLTLPRGTIATPVFMPVGTQATVKALDPQDLEALGAQVVLANAYHLGLRPGAELIERLGGLHRFMGWNGLLLTDSGGFQVFSLRSLTRITDDGVAFRSHIDGSSHFLGPERSMAIQAALGADIAMAFDECPPADAPTDAMLQAMQRTTAWAKRCVVQPRPAHQVRFGIVQGGTDLALRHRHLSEIAAMDFEGMALGGLSVGEGPERMHEVLRDVAPAMPADRPRYLMGVGRPEDLIVAIGAGMDMFDCVMPTRNARNGYLFTETGRVVISNAKHRKADEPIDPACRCPVCATYSRAYLRHLYVSREMLYGRLATIHNLHYVISLVRRARASILDGDFARFSADFFDRRQPLQRSEETAV